MDTVFNDTKTEIWRKFNQERYHNRIMLEELLETAFSVDPGISFGDCCRIIREIAGKECPGIPFSPEAFICLCHEMVKKLMPQNVLIPCADGSEASIFPDGTKVDYVFVDKNLEKVVRKCLSINTIDQDPSKKYDLVLADLPLGPVNGYKALPVRIVEDSISNLSEDGFAVYTFAKGITYSEGKKWINSLGERGLYCNAILDMPINSYGFMTQVDTVIAIFSKKKTKKTFVASLSEESLIEKIVNNFISGTPSNSNPKMGVYVEGEVLSYSQYNEIRRAQNKKKTLSKAYNSRMVKITDVGRVNAPKRNTKKGDDVTFENNVTSVFVPKLGNSPAIASIEEFHIKAQNYFQIVINEEKILQRFLIYFLNTEEGLNLRQMHYQGATIKAFNSKTLGDMEIPCPTIEIQAEYMATYEELETLKTEVESLKIKFEKVPASYKNIRGEIKNINNHGDKFIQWVESLPYPIATILKRYSVSDDLAKKQETLLYFFEAYSIFESTLLSAALDKKTIDCSSLKNVDPAFFEKASFGNWVRMDRALSNLYLGIISKNDDYSKMIVHSCFQTRDDNLIKYLCSKNVCNILEQASEKRNLWKGHGGITSEAVYKEHVDTLDSLLRKIQDGIKDLYDRVRLIRPLGLSFSNGQFDNKVEVLTGSNPIFVKDNIISLKPLDEKKLYIQMIDTGETLELPPYFILKNSPADVKNACYFYSRVEGGNTRYISYHYDGKPEDTESGETAFDIIRELLTN